MNFPALKCQKCVKNTGVGLVNGYWLCLKCISTPVCEVCEKSHAHLYATPTGHIHVECKKKDN